VTVVIISILISGRRYIDTNQQMFIDRLRDAVAIRSVSGWPEVRGEVTQMVQFAAKVMLTLHTSAEICCCCCS